MHNSLNSKYFFIYSIPSSFEMKQKWINAIHKHEPEFNPTVFSKICSMHFLESDYSKSLVNDKKVLKKIAIPSIFVNCKYF